MLLLGLVLLAVSGTFVGLLIADNLAGGSTTQVSVLGSDIGFYTVPKAFLAGAALMLIFLLGAAMAWVGARRARRRSVELEAARQAATTAPTPAPTAVPRLESADGNAGPGRPEPRHDGGPAGATAVTPGRPPTGMRRGRSTRARARHWWQGAH
ncbi:hypothetical protein [Kitasatospora sp. NPDC094015]|uniref:hypothetical protein n=1 Tax=Kitasatospora sp. NPDC094015 TaxID=3155205 RepID=UPI00331CC34E